MKVSVITPFYQGNQYMSRYVQGMEANRKNLQSEDELEVLLVNDSPWEPVELAPGTGALGGETSGPGTDAPGEESPAPGIRVWENPKNCGIHASRVHGLQETQGEYVLFLDQDDELAPDAVAKLLKTAKEYPGSVIVSNAILEQKDARELWYRSEYHKRQVGRLDTYLKVGIQIISPGQCLIPRQVIPELWTRRLCRKNGADDYYLWLLLLQQGVPFVLLDEPLYVHRYTAQNLSADTTVTDDSAFEFLDYMEEEEAMPEPKLRLIRRMLTYKAAFRSGSYGKKLVESAKNPDLFLENVVFKIKSKTPYGFNR